LYPQSVSSTLTRADARDFEAAACVLSLSLSLPSFLPWPSSRHPNASHQPASGNSAASPHAAAGYARSIAPLEERARTRAARHAFLSLLHSGDAILVVAHTRGPKTSGGIIVATRDRWSRFSSPFTLAPISLLVARFSSLSLPQPRPFPIRPARGQVSRLKHVRS